MKRMLVVAILAGVLLAGYVVTAPVIAISQIRAAIQRRDSEKLSAHVDFPSLRNNLKEQLNAQLLKQAASQDNPFGLLVMPFISKLGEGMVDSFITPTGIASLMAGEEPDTPESSQTIQTSKNVKPEPFKNAQYSYDSTSTFSVRVTNDKGEQVRFVLTRSGLTWKLSNILIPVGQFPARGPSSPKSKTQTDSTHARSEPAPFEIELRKKAYRQPNSLEGIREAITFTIMFKNVSGKNVRALEGKLQFADSLDNEILSTRVAIDRSIAADETIEWSGEVAYDQSIDAHQRLKSENPVNLNTHFKPNNIVFADGTTKQFN